MPDAWLHHRETHAHIVHPSPVRAHSYPFHAYGGSAAAAYYGHHASSGSPSSSSAFQHHQHHHPFSSSSSSLHNHFTPHQQHYGGHYYHSSSSSSNQQPPSFPYSSHSQYSYSHSSGGGFRGSDLPSPPLSTSAMPPDPWNSGASDRLTSPSDDGKNHNWSGNHNNHFPKDDYDDYAARDNRDNSFPSPSSHPHKHIIPPLGPMIRTSSHKNKPLKRLPAPYMLETWASLMDKSKGRDKVLKTVQYTFRTYLYVLSLIAGVRPLSRWFVSSESRTKQAVAGLSLTRKCLLLLNPLRPIGALISPEPTSARDFLGHIVDLASAIADDVFCLSKLGLLSRRKGVIADNWANRLWFATTVTGLYGLYVKSFKPRDEDEERSDDWKRVKYLCDLTFVSYDIFGLTWAKEPVQCVAGLIAAIIGTMTDAFSTGQLYDKEWQHLVSRHEVDGLGVIAKKSKV